MALKVLYSCALDPVAMASAGSHVVSIVNELESLGHTVELVHQGPQRDDVECSRQMALGFSRASVFDRLLSDIRYSWVLYKLIRVGNYDLVYHRMAKWSALPSLVFYLQKLPSILELNADVRAELSSVGKGRLAISLYALLERIQISIARKVVVVSEGIGQNLKRLYPSHSEKVVVVENGADVDLYSPRDAVEARARLGLSVSSKYVIYAGSLQRWQGVDTLVRCAPDVIEKHPDIKFIVAGDGSMREEIRGLIASTNLDDAFILTGWLSKEALVDYLAASDICVAPYSSDAALNRQEGPDASGLYGLMKCSPLKLYTYMAMGKPVIASSFIDSGQRLVEWGCGLQFVPDLPESLANSIVSILDDEAMAEDMGKKSVARVLKHHTWNAVARKIIEKALVS